MNAFFIKNINSNLFFLAHARVIFFGVVLLFFSYFTVADQSVIGFCLTVLLLSCCFANRYAEKMSIQI